MGWPLVQFVSAPEDAAAVLLDLNTEIDGAKMWPHREGWDLGSPSLEGAADGVAVSYGDRVLSFTQMVEGPRPVALARQSAIARLLLRPSGWLKFQLASFVHPVYFLLRYAEPQALSFDQVRNGTDRDRWAIGMRLPADAFAWGERVTLPQITLKNDPTVAGGTFTVLPTIVGDAVAPARIRLRYGTGAAQTGRRHMLATSPVPDEYDAPIWWQVGTGDAWTLGADTGAPATSASYAGGSARPVSFATTAAMASRVSGAAPAAVPPGRYKVLGRVIRSDTTSTFATRLGVTTGFSFVYGDTVPLTWGTSAADHAAYVDLGVFRLPQGNPLLDLTGEADVTPVVDWQAQRTSGAGTLRLNGLLLLPVDDDEARTLFVDYPALAPSAVLTDEYHDADLDVVYSRLLPSGVLASMDTPGLQGGFPRLAPGRQNVLHFVEQTSTSRARTAGGTDAPDRVGTTVFVEASYHPRWLYIGDGTA